MIDINKLEPFGIWSLTTIGLVGKHQNGPTMVILEEDFFATSIFNEQLVWKWPVLIAYEGWSSLQDVVDLLHAMVIKMNCIEKPEHLKEQMDAIHLATVSAMVDIINMKINSDAA